MNGMTGMTRVTGMPGMTGITCEQVLQGAPKEGREKEGGLQLRLWNLNICIEKVDAKY